MEKQLPQPNLQRELARALSTPSCTIAPNAATSAASATRAAAYRPPSTVTVYVSADGSDLTGEGSRAHPFATLRRDLPPFETWLALCPPP